MSRLQQKPPAHKRGHPTLQNMNFFYFCGSFLPSWIRIRIQITDPDPDPRFQLNTDPIRIRIRIRIHNPDKTNLESNDICNFALLNKGQITKDQKEPKTKTFFCFNYLKSPLQFKGRTNGFDSPLGRKNSQPERTQV